MTNIIHCCVCGRQISRLGCENKFECPGPPTIMGPYKFACSICARDLDGNGLFPEERCGE